VVPARQLSAVVALVAAAFLVDLFFDWTETRGGLGTRTGLDSGPGFLCFATSVALLLWEVLGALEVVRTRTARADSLVAFFLAAGSALTGIAAVIHLKLGPPSGFESDLAAGAFLAIPLSILLLAGAVAHLAPHVLPPRSPA
jgi:hypothetical protein